MILNYGANAVTVAATGAKAVAIEAGKKVTGKLLGSVSLGAKVVGKALGPVMLIGSIALEV